MKPPAFKYAAPRTLDEAVALLAAHGGDAKLIAGGQSLMPMLNFRLLRPAVLVDMRHLRALPGLAGIGETADGRGLRIGALTTHHQVESSALVAARLPILAHAMTHVAHLAIRNRGTLGGSLAHADPAAEWPALALLLDATVATRSPRGERSIAAREFFVAALTTCLEPDEIVTAVEFPVHASAARWGFVEFARRHGDFAMAGIAAQAGGGDARVALVGLGPTPLRAPAAEALLARGLDRASRTAALDAAAEACAAAADPMSDLHARADYRRHLARSLAARAFAQIAGRA